MIDSTYIKGDAAFVAFAEKLATCAVNATKIGRRITRTDDLSGDLSCCCPLGAHPDMQGSLYPPSTMAQREAWPEVSAADMRAFINGFAGSPYPNERDSPYAQLGLLYREAFP